MSILTGGAVVAATYADGLRGQPFHWLNAHRIGVLFGIGLLHVEFLWHGDILIPYALCGLAAPRRRVRLR